MPNAHYVLPFVDSPRRSAVFYRDLLGLEPVEEQRKHQAISAYHTQMEVMSSFLLSFVRTTELYSTTPVPSN